MSSLVKFNNPILKKIINVYQPNYKNLVAQGFGDFLRGCFCIYQICKIHGLEFDMDLSNHPMHKLLDTPPTEYNYSNIDRNNISWFPNPNYIPTSPTTFVKDSLHFHNEFIRHLNKIKERNYYLFCNSFPIFNFVQDIARTTISNKILPNPEVKKEIENMMYNLHLFRKNFSVIHIRTGDAYLLNKNTLNIELIQKIMNIVNPYINIKKKKYLILSDNNKIKYFFRNYPNCIFNVKSITHLGENGDKAEDKIKNTLIDFYVMGQSNYIISLSPYNWGSGFSHWCSVLYKIPYKSFMI